jgi:hypothetical protein
MDRLQLLFRGTGIGFKLPEILSSRIGNAQIKRKVDQKNRQQQEEERTTTRDPPQLLATAPGGVLGLF